MNKKFAYQVGNNKKVHATFTVTCTYCTTVPTKHNSPPRQQINYNQEHSQT